MELFFAFHRLRRESDFTVEAIRQSPGFKWDVIIEDSSMCIFHAENICCQLSYFYISNVVKIYF